MSADVGSVHFGWCSAGTVDAHFMRSILRLVRSEPVLDSGFAYTAITSGPQLSIARTNLASAMLATAADWLFMIDADMVFDPADVFAVLAAADPDHYPIVGGLARGQDRMTRDTWVEANRVRDGKFVGLTRTEVDSQALVEVDVVGAGFLVIHRRVFEHLAANDLGPLPWFAESFEGDLILGEDFTFCRRAAAAGFPVHVHTGVKVGHVKRQII